MPGGIPGNAIPPFITSGPDPNPDFKKRSIAGRLVMNRFEKRADSLTISSLGGCALTTPAAHPLTRPGWPSVYYDMIVPDQAGVAPVAYSVISRYDRATSIGCVFTTTRLDANGFVGAPQWADYNLNFWPDNNGASLDHACKLIHTFLAF
jgi:hypothetical protein